MQRHTLRNILGRPALHILLAVAFGVAFFWPIFAMTRATQTFHFLYGSWLLALVALFAIGRVPTIERTDTLDGENDDDALLIEHVEETY
jgi:hypothetical protein